MTHGVVLKHKSGWRFFPLWIIGALGIVIAVNAVFISIAEKTFPGETGGDPYDTGIKYNYILDDAAREAGLGWKIAATVSDSHVVIRVRDRAGAPLDGVISAVALRPLGDPTRTALHFSRGEDGGYYAQETLSPGRWDVMADITADNEPYRITEHLIVK